MRAIAAVCVLLTCCATPAVQGEKAAAAKPVADPGQRLAFHAAALIQLMAGTPDCSQAERAAVAYVERNREAMRQALLEFKKREADLAPEVSKQYSAQMMKLVNELHPDAEAALTSFAERCASQSSALGNALDALEKE